LLVRRDFMKRQLVFTILSLLLFCVGWGHSFGQTTANVIFEQAKGTLLTPLISYKGVEDIQVREEASRPCGRYDITDSSLTFVTDSASKVRAAYKGVIKGIFQIEDSYTLLTKFGDYFIIYSGLNKPELKVGDTVQDGQIIGSLYDYRYAPNCCSLQFSVQKLEKSLDACKWLTPQ
jgi:hypothetical protein